jgi:hypothetical protein
MARTGESKTMRMPNGNRVTVTTGSNGGGYYRKVTVRRPDGTAESRTDRKNAGVLNTGLLDLGGYGDGVPRWAGGTQKDEGWGSIIGFAFLIMLVILFFGWPFLPHWRRPVQWTVAGFWWAFLLAIAVTAIASRRKSQRVPTPAGVAATSGESLLAEDHPYRHAHFNAAGNVGTPNFLNVVVVASAGRPHPLRPFTVRRY